MKIIKATKTTTQQIQNSLKKGNDESKDEVMESNEMISSDIVMESDEADNLNNVREVRECNIICTPYLLYLS